ncbi:hypothetical protein ACJX0J_008920 [Zea mays]
MHTIVLDELFFHMQQEKIFCHFYKNMMHFFSIHSVIYFLCKVTKIKSKMKELYLIGQIPISVNCRHYEVLADQALTIL